MKAQGRLAGLLIVVATLMTVCPVVSGAADSAVTTQLSSFPEHAVAECPLARLADSADCGAGGPGPLASISAATPTGQDDQLAGLESNDASGKLLEELVAKAPERQGNGL
jgi:hypothetical protein